MPTNLFPAQTRVRAVFKDATGRRWLPVVQAWDQDGKPWIVGVPDLNHPLTGLIQADVLPNFKRLKPDTDITVESDPADAIQPTQVAVT